MKSNYDAVETIVHYIDMSWKRNGKTTQKQDDKLMDAMRYLGLTDQQINHLMNW